MNTYEHYHITGKIASANVVNIVEISNFGTLWNEFT